MSASEALMAAAADALRQVAALSGVHEAMPLPGGGALCDGRGRAGDRLGA